MGERRGRGRGDSGGKGVKFLEGEAGPGLPTAQQEPVPGWAGRSGSGW